MPALTIEDLRTRNLLLLETVAGSRAYGLALPHSDTDLRGVFYLPKEDFLRGDYVAQVSNATHDETYYEIGRFIELLLQNNPSVLEILATPEHCVRYRHPLMEKLHIRDFLSKQCQQSFAGYAYGQIKKARRLNKKIMNPMAKEKKSLLDFCFIFQGIHTIPLRQWLTEQRLSQQQLGLVKMAHSEHLYAMFVDNGEQGYQGILRDEQDAMLLCSRVPENAKPVGYLHFNQSGFSRYCQDYQAYWQWVAERNEERYQNNQSHGKNYDTKNMMHTFRLLETALEIAQTGELQVERPNREALLAIRRGEFEYETLLAKADQLLQAVEFAFSIANLPDKPHTEKAKQALVAIREAIYSL